MAIGHRLFPDRLLAWGATCRLLGSCKNELGKYQAKCNARWRADRRAAHLDLHHRILQWLAVGADDADFQRRCRDGARKHRRHGE